MTGMLDGKTALITGGAGGFGRTVARMMIEEGATVAIADLGDTDEQRAQLDKVRSKLSELSPNSLSIPADVTNPDDCARMADQTLDAFGHLDILVANAGVFSLAPAWELTEQEWDHLANVNLKGTWLTTKYLVPHMIERGQGRIVMTSSRNGLRVEPNYAHYNATKAGVIGYMKSLALELGPHGITVNAVCPTQMADRNSVPPPTPERVAYWEQVTGRKGATYEDFDRASGEENLLDTGGQPDFSEVAEGVLWLASDRARIVTGVALPMDAGWIVKRGG